MNKSRRRRMRKKRKRRKSYRMRTRKNEEGNVKNVYGEEEEGKWGTEAAV